MRESIGSAFLYNIIFVFIIIVFGLISATLSYYKAFKVNNAILNYISMYSGYNSLSEEAINNYLKSIGYTPDNSKCPAAGKEGSQLVNTQSRDYLYCVYFYEDETGVKEKDESGNYLTNSNGDSIYYAYGVRTYIYVNLPIFGNLKVPVYTKGARMYNFSDGQAQEIGV